MAIAPSAIPGLTDQTQQPNNDAKNNKRLLCICPPKKCAVLRNINYPVNGWRSIAVRLRWLNTTTGVQAMSSCPKFHSIAALRGDGLRPELRALFERLAVEPHSQLFVRADG